MSEVPVEEFDRFWNHQDPAATEEAFRALLPEADRHPDPGLGLELRTQIARTLGLRERFEEAHALLDEVDARLTDETRRAHVRALLERGRTHRSSGDREGSVPCFEKALEVAREIGSEFHAIDAAHMLGITCDPDTALDWNLRAIEFAEDAEDPRARGWLGALLNNTAWSYHDRGEYDAALGLFEKALAFRNESGGARERRIARWAVARCLRSLDRIDDALTAQRALAAEIEADQEAGEDGFVTEEIGECLWSLGRRDEARPFLARAAERLEAIRWVERDRVASLGERGSGVSN